jgi:hypothetical protein
MRWRTTAADETRQMEQRTSKYGQWRRGNNNNDNNIKKHQSTNVWRQRRRTCTAAEAEDNNGWQEAGRSGGGKGVTVVRWQWRNSFTIRQWRMKVDEGQGKLGWDVHSFSSFLGGDEFCLQSYPL